MSKLISFSIVLMLLVFNSCQQIRCGGNKQSFLRGHEKLISAATKAHEKGKKTDNYHAEIERMNSDCYDLFKEDLTDEEKQDYWSDNLEYYAWKYEGDFQKFFEEHEKELEEIAGSIEELVNVTGEQISRFFEEHEQELNQLFETIETDISAWAEKLKEILED